MNPLGLSIPECGARLREGSLTAVTLAEAHLERIAQIDPTIHAFAMVTAETALAAAAVADAALARGEDRGPLHGIPVAVKDLIDIRGTVTACGSRVLGTRATEDAAVVERLARAGAVILGKLATYEFALVGPTFDGPAPPAVNPWNAEHVTGGSSSGSAAAVAAGLMRASLGTDSGGSIRGPACYCGIVGLKPTFGLVSRHGVFPLSPSLDHVGPLAASVTEAALLLDAVAGYDARDSGSALAPAPPAASQLGEEGGQGLEGLRIAYARAWFASDPALMPGILSAMDDAVSQLSLLGARITEVRLPDADLMEAAGSVTLHAESFAVHRDMLRSRGAEYGRMAYQRLAAGIGLTPGDRERALRAARRLREAVDAEVFAHHDALVTVNTLRTAPPVAAFRDGGMVWSTMRTLAFNATGHPVLAMPIGFVSGLPVGMQIVGKAFDEAGICRIGAAFERSTDHTVRRPPLAELGGAVGGDA